MFPLRSLLVVIAISGLLVLPSSAYKPPEALWEMTFSGNGSATLNDICRTSDGGFAAVGSTFTYSGKYVTESSAVLLVRADAGGRTLWTRTFSGAGFAQGASIAATDEGGFVITGQSHPSPNGDTTLLLIKTDADGNRVWEKRYGEGRTSVGNAVAVTRDGGYIVCGSTDAEEEGGLLGLDLYLLRTDPSGERLWERRIGEGELDNGNAVIEAEDGGFVVAGTSSVSGKSDMCLLWTDPSGALLWTENLGNEFFDTGEDLKEFPGEGYVVVGTVFSPIDRELPDLSLTKVAVYMVRTDLSGRPVWKRQLDEQENDLLAHGVELSVDRGFVIVGQKGSGPDAWSQFLLRTDRDGRPVWNVTSRSDGNEIARAIVRTSDGGYVTAGDRANRTGDDADRDGAITRFAPDGGSPGSPLTGTVAVLPTPEPSATPAMPPPAVIWEQTYRLGFSCTGTDLIATRDGGFVIAGSTVATNTTGLVGPPFPDDAFLLRLDAGGAVLWNRTYGGDDGDGANAVRETADGGSSSPGIRAPRGATTRICIWSEPTATEGSSGSDNSGRAGSTS